MKDILNERYSRSCDAGTESSPLGLHRVLEPSGALPQAARRLDASPEIGPDEVRISLRRLNLDAASFRQLWTKHDGDGDAVRAEVLDIVATRGKMQNPVTGSGRDADRGGGRGGGAVPARPERRATGSPPWSR